MHFAVSICGHSKCSFTPDAFALRWRAASHEIRTLRNVDPMLTGRFFSVGPSRRFRASFGRHQAVEHSLVAVSDGTATYSMHTLCATHGIPVGRAGATCARNIRFPDCQCRLLCLLQRGEESSAARWLFTTWYNVRKLAWIACTMGRQSWQTVMAV